MNPDPPSIKHVSKAYFHKWRLGLESDNLPSTFEDLKDILGGEMIFLQSQKLLLDGHPPGNGDSNSWQFFALLSFTKGHRIFARIQLQKPEVTGQFTHSSIKGQDSVNAKVLRQVGVGHLTNYRCENRFCFFKKGTFTDKDRWDLLKNLEAQEVNAPNIHWTIWRQYPEEEVNEERRVWSHFSELQFSCTIKSLLWTQSNDYPTLEPLEMSPGIIPRGFLDIKPLFLFNNQSDLIVIAGNREFPAHKLILMRKSQVFESMFESQMSESLRGRLKIEDYEEGAVEELLRFIYMDQVNNMEEYAIQLVQMAHKYELNDLKVICERHLCGIISEENLIELYKLADLLSLTKLQKRVEYYFIENKATLIKDAEDFRAYLDSCPSLLLTLVN